MSDKINENIQKLIERYVIKYCPEGLFKINLGGRYVSSSNEF